MHYIGQMLFQSVFIKMGNYPLSLNEPVNVICRHIVSSCRATDFAWPQGGRSAVSFVDVALALQELTKIREGGLPCVKYTKH